MAQNPWHPDDQSRVEKAVDNRSSRHTRDELRLRIADIYRCIQRQRGTAAPVRFSTVTIDEIQGLLDGLKKERSVSYTKARETCIAIRHLIRAGPTSLPLDEVKIQCDRVLNTYSRPGTFFERLKKNPWRAIAFSSFVLAIGSFFGFRWVTLFLFLSVWSIFALYHFRNTRGRHRWLGWLLAVMFLLGSTLYTAPHAFAEASEKFQQGLNLHLSHDIPWAPYRFGEVRVCLEVHAASFNDLNRNGEWDEGEPPQAGSIIQLLNMVGELVDETTTTSNGRAELRAPEQGNYILRRLVKEGFVATTSDEREIKVGPLPEWGVRAIWQSALNSGAGSWSALSDTSDIGHIYPCRAYFGNVQRKPSR